LNVLRCFFACGLSVDQFDVGLVVLAAGLGVVGLEAAGLGVTGLSIHNTIDKNKYSTKKKTIP